MKSMDLLATLTSLDIIMEATDGRLRINAPSGVLTLGLRKEIVEHKDELLTLLRDKNELNRDERGGHISPVEAATPQPQPYLGRLVAARGHGSTSLVSALNQDRSLWIEDPRRDLAEDSSQWQRMLRNAYGIDGHCSHGVFASLHGVRCLGVRLKMDAGGYCLTPGELDSSEYAAVRKEWLQPYSLVVIDLLDEISVADLEHEVPRRRRLEVTGDGRPR